MTKNTNVTNTTVTNQPTTTSNIPTNRQLITEGSISMLYPKDVVFYNPVQVQNRDLSLIMIQLYSERYYKRLVMSMKKKELGKDYHQQVKTGSKEEKEQLRKDIDLKLKEFEETIDWKQLYSLSNSSKEKQGLPKNHEHIKGIRILDALAASGLRSLRYYKELNSNLLHSVTINDLDPAAIDLAKENIAYNDLSHALLSLEDEGKCDKGHSSKKIPTIQIHNEDATQLMYLSRRKPNPYSSLPTTSPQSSSKLPIFDQYDVIDLDPYGSAAPFLDSALQSIANGGLLAITCTDMKTLGGSQTDTCYARYGSMPINKSKYLQELALRILLCDIAKRAATYGRNIKPILSVGMNFYVRVFIEVYSHGPSVKNLSCNIGTVYQSVRCPSFHIVPNGQCAPKNENVIQPTRAPLIEKCNETGGPFKTAGPLWLGPLHDDNIVKEAIGRLKEWMNAKDLLSKEAKENGENEQETNENKIISDFEYIKMGKELHGLLTMASEELNDVPLYYVLPDLCHTLGCSVPPMKLFKAALVNAGYRVSGYHKEPQAIKTDAPNSVVWDILRAWCKDNPPKRNSKKQDNKRKKRRKHHENNDNNNENECSQSAMETEEAECNEYKSNESLMSASEKILSVEPALEVDFTIPDKLKVKNRVCRFPMNPQANWGPKKAATGYKRKGEEDN